MKKLYILLTAFFAAVSCLNAGNIVFCNSNDFGNIYTWGGGSSNDKPHPMIKIGEKAQNNGSAMYYYYDDSSFDNCIFAKYDYWNGDSNQTDDITIPSDTNNKGGYFDAYFVNDNGNSKKTVTHSRVRIGLNGSWDGSNWTTVFFTTSGTSSKSKYMTQTLTYQGGNVEFGFVVTDENGGNLKSWGGYNYNFKDEWPGPSTDILGNNNKNSTVSLLPGMQYHFEFDFATHELSLKVHEPDIQYVTTTITPSQNSAEVTFEFVGEGLPNIESYYLSLNGNTYGPFYKKGTFTITGLNSGQDYNFSTCAYVVITGQDIKDRKPECYFNCSFTTTEPPVYVYHDSEGYRGLEAVSSDAEYHKVTLWAYPTSAKIYYNFDYDDNEDDNGRVPSDSDIPYTVPFMVVKDCTIRVIAVDESGTSKVDEFHLDVTTNAYEWDDVTEKARQLQEFIIPEGSVRIQDTKTIVVDVTNISGVEVMSSWAKYEAYDYYDHADKWTLENADHDTGMNGDWIKTVENNHTNSHDCSNFQDAYYRYYAEATTRPAGMKKAAGAGSINPERAARIAYTANVKDNTTGVDEIVDDNVAAEVDPDAPVFFYNLQGVMVDGNSLVPGNVYIRVQGAAATKLVAQ